MTDTTDIDYSQMEIGGLIGRKSNLFLGFIDSEGKDLVEGIEVKPKDYIGTDFVALDQYTLISSPDYYELGYFSNSTTIYHDTHPYPRLEFDPYIPGEWQWDESYFRSRFSTEEEYTKFRQISYDLWKEYQNARNGLNLLGIVMDSGDMRLEKITYTLTCPHVFGDDTAHEIVSYWRDPDSGPSYYSICYKVTFDGKECTDIAYANRQQTSFATIVLDR
jgi:hypothetical protein